MVKSAAILLVISILTGILAWTPTLANAPVERGDVNNDGQITMADVVHLGNYLFARGPAPVPDDSTGDANCDGRVTLKDAVYLVNHILRGGPEPRCPTR